MNLPKPDDYIDIHTHGSLSVPGVFSVETLLAHESRKPENIEGIVFTAGVHPWYLSESNQHLQLEFIRQIAADKNLIAIGEVGFDRLRGPSFVLQRKIFESQVRLAETWNKPVIVHCVKAWDELLAAYKKLRPGLPWLVHGFRGKKELADQLIDKGMYLSLWFDFAIRQESEELINHLPKDRIFLETDGADISITAIYQIVSRHLNLSLEELKMNLFSNFVQFFNLK
jgi:TatD DNase family protein